MKRWLLFGLLATNVAAQVLRPIDMNKRADDINNKNLTLPNANFQTLPQGTRTLSLSPLSNQQQQFNEAPTKQIELKSVGFADVSTPTLAKTNVVPPTASVTDQKHETKDVPTAKAPITDRQIRVHTPTGEEELKKQLNEPH